ncbi:hypothetical protein [Paraburkholderia caballeronis]|uniref:hypothetical protein n=1 Tax=Paraburkholderia caballeronis TaxID=416943 RepID=UPI0010652A01|nr:hypothetical protein [Paraburkholderia caballeronis]TDV04687.1 hypothetical protein C7408_13149 [Paraburkholderia caballeronis]TDV07930.1 hypothetical protein C7406_13349 [Paraburkholderia caballeronis]TDV18221.1 hypothetical protein C7404_13149 [Paraburkholderia caballeronis]
MDAASKKLVYQNLARGVAPEAQAAALGTTVEEVERTFREVGLALANWMLQETVPYVPCQTVASALRNRRVLLQHLASIDLDSVIVKFHRVRAARVAVEK